MLLRGSGMTEGWKQCPKPRPGLNVHRQLHTRPRARRFVHALADSSYTAGLRDFHSHFTDEENVARGDEVTCPRPQSESGQELESELTWTSDHWQPPWIL